MRMRPGTLTLPAAVILAVALVIPAWGAEVAAAAPTRAAAVVDQTTSTTGPGDTTTISTSSTTSTSSPITTTTSARPAPPPSAAPPSFAPPSLPSPSDTTTAPSTTSTSLGATTTSLDPTVLANLLNGLDADVAQAQAVNDYLAARAAAAAAASAGSGQSGAAGTDPVLVEAAAAQLRAASQQAAANKAYQDAQHKIAQVAVQLYVGEQPARAGTDLVSNPADRVAYVQGILASEERQAKQAKLDFATATAAATASRRQADDLVQARTTGLQTLALQAENAAALNSGSAGAGAAATGSAPAAPAGTGTGAGAGSAGTSAGAGSGAAGFGAGGTGRLPPALGLLAQQSPSILGPPVLSGTEVLGWYTSTGRQANITVGLDQLVGDYFSVGGQAGVRPDLAFAQTMVETGYLAFPSFGQVAVADNNFAGIGACDSCARGFHFPDALTGVTAQMQLLHAYATTVQPFPGPLPGPFSVTGCCQTWMALSGVWATNTAYGIEILTVYRAMVHWALAQRRAQAHL